MELNEVDEALYTKCEICTNVCPSGVLNKWI
jgi:ferredoxin